MSTVDILSIVAIVIGGLAILITLITMMGSR